MLSAGLASRPVRKAPRHPLVGVRGPGRARKRRPQPLQAGQPPEPGESDHARLTQAEVRAVAAAAALRNAARWSVGLACGLRAGRGSRPALAVRGSRHRLARHLCFQLQRLLWEHGCVEADKKLKAITDPKLRKKRIAEILAECTEGKHRCRCPKRCPKKLRKSGRPGTSASRRMRRACVPPTARAMRVPVRSAARAALFPPGDQGEAAQEGPPPAAAPSAAERAPRRNQYLERLSAERDWVDHDLVFCEWNGLPRPAARLGRVVRGPEGGRAPALPAARDAALGRRASRWSNT